MAVNAGRVAAARVLVAVDGGAHADEALAAEAPRTGPDRGLAWYLVFGVLRHRAHVDAALRPHLARPLPSLDPEVAAVLRMAAFEKLYSRAPAHAVVHQAVDVAVAVGVGRARGLVNAVLRRVETPAGLSRAEELDHPAWLVDRWTSRYGVEATDAWCRSNADPPPLFVVAHEKPAFRAEPVVMRGSMLADVWRTEGVDGPIQELPGFLEGKFWVQDAASVMVADLVQARQGLRVLDACAAPGGKSFRLASQGAEVRAVDWDEARLALLSSSAERLGLYVPVRVHDWANGPLDVADFDVVLVDAPCTALGTVRRHPEIRWRRQPDDVAAMTARQSVVLENAAKAAPVVVYAVCSPEPEEGPEVIRAFLAAHPEYALEAELSTAPPEADEDAFYAARIRRA